MKSQLPLTTYSFTGRSQVHALDESQFRRRREGVVASLLTASVFYVMLNFDDRLNTRLQVLVGFGAMVVILTSLRTIRGLRPAILAAVWILSSALVLQRSTGTVQYGLRLVSAIIAPVAIVAFCGAYRALRMFATTLLIVASTSVFLEAWRLTQGQTNSASAWRGIYHHKNTFGFSCALTIVVCLGEIGSGGSSRARCKVLLFGVATASVALFMANSATALAVSLVCGSLVLLMSAKTLRQRSLRRVIVAAGIAWAPLLLWALSPSQLAERLGRDGTLTGRTQIWKLVSDILAHHRRPWDGYGLAFWTGASPDALSIWRAVGWTPFSSHNSYLDWLLMFGRIGFVFLLLWIGPLLFRTFQLRRKVNAAVTLFPLLIAVLLSSSAEQYLISVNGLMVVSLVGALTAAFEVKEIGYQWIPLGAAPAAAPHVETDHAYLPSRVYRNV